MNEIEKAKETLKNAGYYVDNLWQVSDVKLHYACDDDQAQSILDDALTNEATMEQIWFAIHMVAENEELTKLNSNT